MNEASDRPYSNHVSRATRIRRPVCITSRFTARSTIQGFLTKSTSLS